MEGLDVTTLNLSEVRDDNEKLRIDDGFFSKLAVFTQKRIENLPHVRLGETCSIFRKGIFDIKAESYVESGIPFVRIGDLKGGLIDDSSLAFISEEAHAKESATALVRGDVVLSKTAYAAASLVNLPHCNVSQDTIAVRIAPAWSKKLHSGFLVSFLNTKHGIALMERQFQGNVQAHLSLQDGRKLPIPLFGDAFQKQIHETFLKADRFLVSAKNSIAAAEQTLLRALGLEGWQPPEPLTYTRRASEALAAARLDAEYFAPRVEQLLSKLRADDQTLADVAPARHEAFDPKAPKVRHIPAQGNALGTPTNNGSALKGRHKNAEKYTAPTGLNDMENAIPGALPQAGMNRAIGPDGNASSTTFPYIEIGALRGDGTCASESIPLDEAPSRASQLVRRGDIITSTVRPIRRLSALILPEQHGHVCSSGFVVLEPKAIASEVLLTYLRLPIICELMDLHTSASLYPAISERDLLKLPIPHIPSTAAKQITTQIRQAHAARREAQQLPEKAKRAVEVAIEEGEEKALYWLQKP